LVTQLLARDPARRPVSGARVAQTLRTLIANVAPGFGSHQLASIVAQCLPEAAGARPSGQSLTAAFAPSAPSAPLATRASPVAYAPTPSSPPRAAPPMQPMPAPVVAPMVPMPLPHAPPAYASRVLEPRAGLTRGALIGIGAALGIVVVCLAGIGIHWFVSRRTNETTQRAMAAPAGDPHACDRLATCCALLDAPDDLHAHASCSALPAYRAQNSSSSCDAVLAALSVHEYPLGRWPAACGEPDRLALNGQRCAQVARCCAEMQGRAGSLASVFQVCPTVTATRSEETCATFAASIRGIAGGGPSWPALPAVCAE
jgi:hypothetical protein